MVQFSNQNLFVAFFKKTIEINTKINTLQKKIYRIRKVKNLIRNIGEAISKM